MPAFLTLWAVKYYFSLLIVLVNLDTYSQSIVGFITFKKIKVGLDLDTYSQSIGSYF